MPQETETITIVPSDLAFRNWDERFSKEIRFPMPNDYCVRHEESPISFKKNQWDAIISWLKGEIKDSYGSISEPAKEIIPWDEARFGKDQRRAKYLVKHTNEGNICWCFDQPKKLGDAIQYYLKGEKSPFSQEQSADGEVETILTEAAREGRRILFYPSSGENLKWVFDIDYDMVISADYLCGVNTESKHRRSHWKGCIKHFGQEDVKLLSSTEEARVYEFKGKRGIHLFKENKEVLEIIKNTGNRISCFVGVCDGCLEGGNTYCVNDPEFLTQVVSISSPGMLYITDHSNIIPYDTYKGKCAVHNLEYILKDKRFFRSDPTICKSNQHGGGYGNVVHYMVSNHTPTVYEWRNQRLRVTIEHDNIANHFSEISGALLSNYTKRVLEERYRFEESECENKIVTVDHEYFRPSIGKNWSSEESLCKLLETCEENKWDTVGTTVFGENQHSGFIGILDKWNGQYPKWIRLFHLDSNDYAELKGKFAVVTTTVGKSSEQ